MGSLGQSKSDDIVDRLLSNPGPEQLKKLLEDLEKHIEECKNREGMAASDMRQLDEVATDLKNLLERLKEEKADLPLLIDDVGAHVVEELRLVVSELGRPFNLTAEIRRLGKEIDSITCQLGQPWRNTGFIATFSAIVFTLSLVIGSWLGTRARLNEVARIIERHEKTSALAEQLRLTSDGLRSVDLLVSELNADSERLNGVVDQLLKDPDRTELTSLVADLHEQLTQARSGDWVQEIDLSQLDNATRNLRALEDTLATETDLLLLVDDVAADVLEVYVPIVRKSERQWRQIRASFGMFQDVVEDVKSKNEDIQKAFAQLETDIGTPVNSDAGKELLNRARLIADARRLWDQTD